MRNKEDTIIKLLIYQLELLSVIAYYQTNNFNDPEASNRLGQLMLKLDKDPTIRAYVYPKSRAKSKR